jgi:hypothetical protein
MALERFSPFLERLWSSIQYPRATLCKTASANWVKEKNAPSIIPQHTEPSLLILMP